MNEHKLIDYLMEIYNVKSNSIKDLQKKVRYYNRKKKQNKYYSLTDLDLFVWLTKKIN